MAKVKLNLKSPKTDLQWINVTGKGKLKYDPDNTLDKSSPHSYQYTATAVLSKAEAETMDEQLMEFWKNNKPSDAKGMKFSPLKEVMAPVNGADGKPTFQPDGEPIVKGTGVFHLAAKTNAVWPDGKPNMPQVLRGNGNPLVLGDKTIGDGTIGVLHTEVCCTAFGDNQGLSCFLKAVQVVKYVAPSDAVEAEDLSGGEEDDGMEDFGVDAVDETAPTQDAPKI